MKLAILATHPVQYVAPIFRELAKFPDLNFKFFLGCDHGTQPQEDPNFGVVFKWDSDPIVGYDHEFLPNGSIEKGNVLRLACYPYDQYRRE